MTVNKRLLFGSLAVARVGCRRRGRPANTGDDSDRRRHTPSANDLSPTIGTNAVVAGQSLPRSTCRPWPATRSPPQISSGRPLVVNFWYSTCAPCKKELPGFAAVHAKFGDQVRFVGIDSLPPSDTEENFARDRGVQYELLYDPNGELTSVIGVAAYPQTLFIDAHGKIVEQTGELTAERLEH